MRPQDLSVNQSDRVPPALSHFGHPQKHDTWSDVFTIAVLALEYHFNSDELLPDLGQVTYLLSGTPVCFSGKLDAPNFPSC